MPEEKGTTTLTGNKPLFQSTTIIGVLIMVMAHMAAMFGFDVKPDDISAITQHSQELWGSVVVGGGAALAIWGRIKATKRIGSSGGSPQ